MKEYGIDLQKQYRKIVQDELTIISKIRKRRDFLIKQATPDVIKLTGRHFIDNDDVQRMLDDIIAIEKAYCGQTKQLDLFRSTIK